MMFTGTNQQQDTRFSDKEKKLMKQMKFGDCLNKRVDMSKVKLDVLRPWISKKITDILHIEDDVVVEFVYNQLEEEKYPCPKKMQINMTGFLNGKNARQFMGELWALLLSAQDSESGIPAEFIQQKKDEILRREEEQRQEQAKRDRSRTPFEKDRDRGNRRDRSGRERSKEHSIHPDMPASTLTAIEQVRCQLKSRSNSTDAKPLSNVTVKNNSTENVARNRSKSPKVKSTEAVAKSRNRSRSRDRRHSRDRSSHRASGERNSPPPRRRNSRDRDRRRSKRRSVDRKRRSSRSRDRSSRPFHSSHRRSRSNSPQKRSDNLKSNTSRRSIERRSKSRSPEKRKQSPKYESKKYSPTPVATKPGINGIDIADTISEKKLTKVQGKLFELAAGTSKTKSRSRSRSRSRHASPPTNRKMKDSKSRSRSLPKKRGRQRSSSNRTSSSCASSPASDRKKKISRSVSRDSRSPSHSPENRRDDFEIQKSKNSVQKKRHYRNNRNSSSGSSLDRTMDERTGEKRRDGYRRVSPRGRSPQAIRNQRSRSGRRSRSRSRSRSRIRNRSRSLMRRSRSPRRFNRRWSPNFHHYRGRGGPNRGRMNHWRRSHSRGRGRNMSPQRRFSPQRRYSRDRRSPQMQMQYRDRKFSPARRYSPQPQARRSRERRPSSRDRRPASRDRRPSSPIREFSRERRVSRERRRSSPLFVADFGGRSKPKTDNRWEMSSVRGAKPKQRISSESSNWEETDHEQIKNKSPKKSSPAPSRSSSPRKGTERRARSKSRSQERHKKNSSPAPKALVGKDKFHTTERSSVEYLDPVLKTSDVSKQEKEKDDYKRKTMSDTIPEMMPKQPSSITEQQQLELGRSKEVSRTKYTLSLSRTPSPFLKPHEREKSGQVAATHKKTFDKKPDVTHKTNIRDTESSSSDSSADSDDSDEDERTVFPKRIEKRTSKTRKSSDSDRSVGEKKVPMKGKRTEHKNATRDGNSHKNAVETRAKFDHSSRGVKVLDVMTSSDLMDRSVPSADSKKCIEERRRIVSSVDSDYDGKTKQNEKASRKRTRSISGLKKLDHNTTDSEYDQVSKKKRKKNKKIARRNSDNDSSESEGETKKKKHKKHKKHSKKNKKHKKHKKKSKKADNTSSSDEESDDEMAKVDLRARFPGINEDLEKQLRERALKSMKKID